MNKKNNPQKLLYPAGSAITLLGVFTHLFKLSFAPYIFSTGVALLLFVQIKHTLDTRKAEIRLRRLSRNALFATLLLGIGAYFMFVGSNSWVVAVLIYALTTLFLSYRGNNNQTES